MKLPKPRKRGHSYRIELMINGERISATRDTAKECEQWAARRLLEAKAQTKLQTAKETLTFAELLTLYYERVSTTKRGKTYEKDVMRRFLRDYPALGEMQVHEITPKILTDWRNSRLKTVKSGTVRREFAFLSVVMTYAVKELFIIDSNPFLQVQKPVQAKPRNRRITDSDIDLLLDAATYRRGTSPRETRHYVAWAFLFAILTGMRRGELLGIKKAHIKNGYIHLPMTKNGEARDVPLTAEAKDALSWVKVDDALIPLTLNSFNCSWKRLVKRAGFDDLTFHDTRHEAISRFVKDKGLQVETLMKITGHKDARTLINTYYNPTIDELIDAVNR